MIAADQADRRAEEAAQETEPATVDEANREQANAPQRRAGRRGGLRQRSTPRGTDHHPRGAVENKTAVHARVRADASQPGRRRKPRGGRRRGLRRPPAPEPQHKAGRRSAAGNRADRVPRRRNMLMRAARTRTTNSSPNHRRYGRVDLLMIYELGYMELDRRGAELLFQVLTEREEKNSIAIASNESFAKTFTDPASARPSSTASPSTAPSSKPAPTPTDSPTPDLERPPQRPRDGLPSLTSATGRFRREICR